MAQLLEAETKRPWRAKGEKGRDKGGHTMVSRASSPALSNQKRGGSSNYDRRETGEGQGVEETQKKAIL